MRKRQKLYLLIGIALLAAFCIWTALIQFVDVQNVGVNETKIGLATFNTWFFNLTGSNMTLYTITDWLGLVPILVCICFGFLGLVQLIRRRSLFKVDSDILILGVYYIVVIVCYLVFEVIPINYRPILINGYMEASYPSSTTLLVLSVMPTLKYQVDKRVINKPVRTGTSVFVIGFSMFVVIGRLVSGVHWITDIIGSVLLSSSLFMFYVFFGIITSEKKEKQVEEKRNGIQ